MINIDIENLAKKFRPYELANAISFQEGLKLADKLLTYDFFYDPWQHYAIELLYSIRDRFPIEWGSSWRYDAYLGDVCVLARRYQERFEAYQMAITKVSPIPPELLVALASCNSSPGKPPVSEEEALQILVGVAQKKPYIDVVRMIVKGCYNKLRENPSELIYWEKLYDKLEKANNHEELPDMAPKFIEGEIKIDISKLPDHQLINRNEELLKIAKMVISKEKIPSSIRGIAVEWKGEEIILWIYFTGEDEAEVSSFSLAVYTRIAAYYLKDYSNENNKVVKVQQKLPFHKNWVLIHSEL